MACTRRAEYALQGVDPVYDVTASITFSPTVIIGLILEEAIQRTIQDIGRQVIYLMTPLPLLQSISFKSILSIP